MEIMKQLQLNFILKIGILYLLLIVIGFTSTVPAFGVSGKYLVAVEAAGKNDFNKASKNYLALLKRGVSETLVIQDALLFSVLANDQKSAFELSEFVEEQGLQIPTAGLISLVKLYQNKQFDKVPGLLFRNQERFPKFLTTLVRGWIEIETGSFEKGIELFNSLNGASHYLGLYNCAVAYAIEGDFQNALPYLKLLEGKKIKFDAIQLQTLAEIYSNNNQNDKAIELLLSQTQSQNSSVFEKVIFNLKTGKRLEFIALSSSLDALANIFYLMGSTNDSSKTNPIISSFYIQLAEFLSKDKDYYNIRLAETFADIQAFNYSMDRFNRVTSGSKFYLIAQLGISDILVREAKVDAARSVLENLLNEGYKEFVIFDSLADIFRTKEDYLKAIYYYDTALKTINKEDRNKKWSTVFVRGICYDQSGNWLKAKVDLKNALELSPNHPEILNYFGYSLIERNENLEEALGMIKNAVSQRPDSGYIVDSLGWGLFRLGQYKEAIVPMERAILLEPHDPIVNDHLGDVLWMNGRRREATFQWQRAIFFGPTSDNEKKIRKKLRFGITDL